MAEPAYFYIRLERSPWLTYQNSTAATKYHWIHDQVRPFHFEIDYVYKGTLIERRGGREYIYPEGSVHAFIKDQFTEHLSPGEYHEFSICMKVHREPVPISTEEILRWDWKPHQAIIPDRVEDPVVCQKLAPLIKKSVHTIHSADPVRNLRSRATIYEILALLTEYSLNQVRAAQSTGTGREAVYCQAACDYIAAHLQEKLRVKDIARQTGISYNYLNQLFSRHMGVSIVEYINRERIQQVEGYLLHDGMSQEEAAAAVGFCSAEYLRRVFRQQKGMTVSEYKRLHRQEQPWSELLP